MPPEHASPALELLTEMWLLWHTLAAKGEAQLQAQHGLELRQFISLGYLQASPVQPAELAQILGLPRYEISRLLAKLEERQLLTRSSTKGDGRKVDLLITEQGRALWQAALTTVEDLIDPLLARLQKGQLEQLIQTLLTLQRLGEEK